MLSENIRECCRLVYRWVLILVLLEHALWALYQRAGITRREVLILVLLEHALWVYLYNWINDIMLVCLNPCFIGTCSLRLVICFRRKKGSVLILVLLEHALWGDWRTWGPSCVICLNPCFIGTCSLSPYVVLIPSSDAVLILVLLEHALWASHKRARVTSLAVLILVLLEHALWEVLRSPCAQGSSCLNPCFIGTCSLSKPHPWIADMVECLNPCFIGTCSLRPFS